MLKSCLAAAALLAALGAVNAARADIFESVNAPGLCLNVTSGGVSILPCDGGPTQDLAVEEFKNGYIIAAGAACLVMAGENRSPKVVFCDSTPRLTEFQFYDDGSIVGDGLCLDVKGGGRKPGTTVVGYRCNGQLNQRWERTETGTTIEDTVRDSEENLTRGLLAANSAPNLCLDTDASGLIDLQPCSTAMTFEVAAGSAVTLIRTDSGECISPDGRQGDQLSLEPCSANSVAWGLTSNGLLRNQEGLCADIERNGRRAGTRVIFFKCSGNQNQRFTLIEQ